MLTLAVVAAFLFDDPADPGATRLHDEVQDRGFAPVLGSVCGLGADRGVGRLVARHWRALAPGWAAGNHLLSLRSPKWAWRTAAR
jgi:hypothetical protein